ncbi:MAG: toxic anion resistance protein, partial [Dermatophilaceae bacterium]
AAQLDELLVDKIAEVRFAGQEETAQALEAEALFAVRQRRQALVTSLAASMQNYMALSLLQKTNKELGRACDNATTTTIGVLKTAVITSEALDRQKLVLNQIEALNTVTGDMMVANAERLKTQGLAIQKQAAEAAIPAEKLAAGLRQHHHRPRRVGCLPDRRQRLDQHHAGRDAGPDRAGSPLRGAGR